MGYSILTPQATISAIALAPSPGSMFTGAGAVGEQGRLEAEPGGVDGRIEHAVVGGEADEGDPGHSLGRVEAARARSTIPRRSRCCER